MLKQYQDYLDKEKTRVLTANGAMVNLPFEWHPEQQPTKAVILIHGLFETAYSLKAIGELFKENNYLVRGVLLPGHGTHPRDLCHVSLLQWQEVLAMAIDSLPDYITEINLVGFSLGGGLSVNYVCQKEYNKKINNIILLAPLVKIKTIFSPLIPSFKKLNIKWLNYAKQTDPIKYQQFAMNSVYQAYCLTQENKNIITNFPDNINIFCLVSMGDAVISSKAAIDFIERLSNKNNKIIHYKNLPHICLPYSPKDNFYGKAQVNKTSYTKTLRYNPYFDDLINQLQDFLF